MASHITVSRQSSAARRDWILWAALVVGALAAAPLFYDSGFLNTRGGGDSPFLLFRLQQLTTALRQGVFPVRWMPDAALGLGYPFFNYYAALPFYLAAFLRAVGLTYVLALKASQLTGFGVAGWAMYGWLRTSGAGRATAFLAAGAYTFAPFHLANVYVRGDSLSEFWAFALYPLILWAARRLVERPSINRAISLALAYAALLLTHNISALIFTPFVLLYLAFLAVEGIWGVSRQASSFSRQAGDDANSPIGHPSTSLKASSSRSPRSASGVGFAHSPFGRWTLFIGHCLLALALGLALSAFFWFPALLEGKYGQLGPVTQGYFNYANHFRAFDLVQLTPLFNYDIGSGGSTPFAMGLVQAILVILGVGAIPIRAALDRRLTSESLYGLLGLGVATFMVTPLSRPLWDHLPLLPFVQFPWRLLSIQSLFAAVCIGQLASASASATPQSQRSTRNSLIALSTTAVLALTALGGLHPDFTPVRDADVTPDRLQLYEYFTGNIGTTIRHEYLPRSAVPRPYASAEFLGRAPEIRNLAGAATGERLGKGAASQDWRVEVSSSGAAVAFPLLYWPGWEARVDGKPVPVAAAPGLGWITVALPQGSHKVHFQLARTPLRALAEFVSFLALGLVIWGSLSRSRNWPAKHPEPVEGRFAGRLRQAQPAGSRLICDLLSLLGSRLGTTRTQTGDARARRFSPLRLGYGLLALVVLAVVLRGLRGMSQAGGDTTAPLNMDFDQIAYPHREVVGFEDGSKLATVVYKGEQASTNTRYVLTRGGSLEVGLGWEVARAALVQLTLVSPAEPLFGAAYSLSTVRTPLEPITTASLPIPDSVPPGVYLLRLALISQDGASVPALTSSGQKRGALYLAPVWVDDPGGSASSAPIGNFGPAIELRQASAEQLTPLVLRLRLDWRSLSGQPENYAIALRLRDPSGEAWAALDTQPAYGLYPTSLWRPGEVVPDRYDLSLPNGIPPGSYTLTVKLYDAVSLDPIGSAEIPVTLQLVPPTPTTNVPHLTDWLGLAGVDFPAQLVQGDHLTLGPRWITLAQPPVDAQARWSLVNSSGEEAYVETLPLAAASNPTTWPAPGLIASRGRLSLPAQMAPGTYTLQIQLVDPAGAALSEGVRIGTVTVQERKREFAPPQPQTDVGATFGGRIKLWGFDLSRSRDEITLTPYWGALTAPEADYKFFVHLTDPTGETIVAQVDDFPRQGQYPTSKWAEGEVVSDTVHLPLAGVLPGTYRLSTGWYEPNSLNRLPAVDADGQPVPDNRVIVIEKLKIR